MWTGPALAVLFAAAASSSLAQQSARCVSDSAAARLDHVPIMVHDLSAARRLFGDTLGFSFKPGRVHANGLHNLHMRFHDGSELELISIGVGQADSLSQWYERFLAEGEGAAFAALDAGPASSVVSRLGDLGRQAVVVERPAFDSVSFPEGHPLHSLFFIHVRSRPEDRPEHYRHSNGAISLSEVWLETDNPEMLAELLARLGALRCGAVWNHAGVSGVGFGLSGGTLVSVSRREVTGEPRIVSVVLEATEPRPAVYSAGVWIEWRAGES